MKNIETLIGSLSRAFLSSFGERFLGGAMQRYILRRLLAVIPTLFFASIIVFMVIRILPGDAVDLIIKSSPFMEDSEQLRKEIEADLGLDKPMHIQYFYWVRDIVVYRDLGTSLIRETPVGPDIAERVPVTMTMGILAVVFALAISIPIGVYSAMKQDTVGDHVGRSFAILGLAIPSFWLGTMIVILPAIWWGWSPPSRLVPFFDEPFRYLSVFVTPAAILGASLAAVTMRMTRTMMLEVLRQDYVRTAWAKGLKERLVVVRHALKNALIPVVTLIGLELPILVGGSVIVENIFNLAGLGNLFLQSLADRDYTIVSGINLFFGTAVLMLNLVVDLLYAYLDPRIRYQ